MFRGVVTGLILVLLSVALDVRGQKIETKGRFLTDSVKIGIPLGYSLSVKYPKEIDIVFPDSLHNYAPYEFESKRYFPTQSDATHSYDSAVYFITSFEVDSIQTFRLPVYVLHGGDSTPVYATLDTVFLQHLVAEIPDSIATEAMPLKENTTYKRVTFQFNYPYFIIGTIILLIIGVVLFILFGGKIRKYFKEKRLQKWHVKFIEKYDAMVLTEKVSKKEKAEQVLIIWKQYLEKLEKKPYTQLTTKEIILNYKPESIEDSLKILDRTIYSSQQNGAGLVDQFSALKKYAQLRFDKKIEEVKHG